MSRYRREYCVVESDGVGAKIHKCVNRYAYNGGLVYEYKNEKGAVDYVLVPHKYRYGGLDGRLLIGKNKGNVSAAVMVGSEWMVGKSVDADAPGEDFSLLARTHVAAMGYRSLYERAVPWKWLVIGIAVLVGVVGVVWFIRSQGV